MCTSSSSIGRRGRITRRMTSSTASSTKTGERTSLLASEKDNELPSLAVFRFTHPKSLLDHSRGSPLCRRGGLTAVQGYPYGSPRTDRSCCGAHARGARCRASGAVRSIRERQEQTRARARPRKRRAQTTCCWQCGCHTRGVTDAVSSARRARGWSPPVVITFRGMVHDRADPDRHPHPCSMPQPSVNTRGVV